jgi:hypothetical protein
METTSLSCRNRIPISCDGVTAGRDHSLGMSPPTNPVRFSDHGPYGVEAQFDRNEEFRYTLVIRWVEEERRAARGQRPRAVAPAAGIGRATPRRGPARPRGRSACTMSVLEKGDRVGAAQKNGMRD